MSKRKICQEIKCEKGATKEMRGMHLCEDHYISLVYDMVPLALKSKALAGKESENV